MGRNCSAPLLLARQPGKWIMKPEGRLDILRGVDFNIAEGEAVAILGASGSGRTTLLSLLAGLDMPSVSISARMLPRPEHFDEASAGSAMMPPSPLLLARMMRATNLSEAMIVTAQKIAYSPPAILSSSSRMP